MRVIIAGSRDLQNAAAVSAAMDASGFVPTQVVSGAARGADALGEAWAQARGIAIRQFPADWSHGRSAGPIRNARMAAYADALVAVWDGRSPGTRNMISTAQRRGLQVYVHRLDDAHLSEHVVSAHERPVGVRLI